MYWNGKYPRHQRSTCGMLRFMLDKLPAPGRRRTYFSLEIFWICFSILYIQKHKSFISYKRKWTAIWVYHVSLTNQLWLSFRAETDLALVPYQIGTGRLLRFVWNQNSAATRPTKHSRVLGFGVLWSERLQVEPTTFSPYLFPQVWLILLQKCHTSVALLLWKCRPWLTALGVHTGHEAQCPRRTRLGPCAVLSFACLPLGVDGLTCTRWAVLGGHAVSPNEMLNDVNGSVSASAQGHRSLHSIRGDWGGELGP